MSMLCLPVWAPWGTLMFLGGGLAKDVENRSWALPKSYKPPLEVLIYQGKKWDPNFTLTTMVEMLGLEPGGRVVWFHDEKRRLVGLQKSEAPDSYKVSCYGCHGGGRINAPILTALEAPGDRLRRDLRFDQEAGMYCFSIAPMEKG